MVVDMHDSETSSASHSSLPASRPASPTTVAEAVAFFTAHGLATTPVRHGETTGRLPGWSQPGHSAAASTYLEDDDAGVLNGTQPDAGWFVHDVAVGATFPDALRIARRLLPTTGWRYGWPTKPETHWTYLVGKPLRTRTYVGSDGTSLMALRGMTGAGQHSLSVAPGSRGPSGELIGFCEPRGEIGRIDDPDTLDRAVQHTAVAIVVGQVWPAAQPHRLLLAFATVLLEHEVPPAQALAILDAATDITGSDKVDVEPAVCRAAEALDLSHTAEGGSAIREVLGHDVGQEVLAAIARILRSGADETAGVVMEGGRLVPIVDCSELALLRSAAPIYQRGGMLIRPITLPQVGRPSAVGEVDRDAGARVLRPVREPWLIEQMSRSLAWYQRKGDALVPADPKPLYARALLHRGAWRFPVLRGVRTAPTLDRDGRIIEQPGFDAPSGLLLDFAQGTFPPVPVAPTREDAEAALATLLMPLRGFAFVNAAARSVALSAMLTALVRLALRAAPLHGFDAPTAGTGKSLLAEVVGLLATGARPAAMSQGKCEAEDEKRLSTVLSTGDPIIHIDNCERPLMGDFLCSMLTQEVVQARILGYSERRVLPSTALVLASGNNLTCVGDVARRAVFCRLDAEVERPDTRTFDFDCHHEVRAHRPTPGRRRVDDAPRVYPGRTTGDAKLGPMGSFDDWAWVRGALAWLGCADPAETRQSIVESDPRQGELFVVMRLWDEAFGSRPMDVASIGTSTDPEVRVLRRKLLEVACRGTWSGRSVGWWLRRHKDRVVAGLSGFLGFSGFWSPSARRFRGRDRRAYVGHRDRPFRRMVMTDFWHRDRPSEAKRRAGGGRGSSQYERTQPSLAV